MTDGVVLITTSPIPSHPSTAIIDTTIQSVRARTDWPILIVADGVRPELETSRLWVRDSYREYLDVLHTRLVADQVNDTGNIGLFVLTEWRHQAGAVHLGLQDVALFAGFDPELLLFVEHDTPLVGEWPWYALCAPLRDGTANVVRSYHEKVLIPAHGAMLLDYDPRDDGLYGLTVPLYRTRQWSQRPHLARTDYYRRMLDTYFPPDARTMIEDRQHGILESADWNDHKVWLWLPEGDYPDGTGLGTQRSDHLDGRAGDEKYPMDFGGRA